MKTRRFIWSTAGVIVVILGTLCWISLGENKKLSQLIGIPLAGVGSFLMVPELFGEKSIDKWQKRVIVVIVGLEEQARSPLPWSSFLVRWKNIYDAQFRSALWVCIPIGIGFLIQGQWITGLFLMIFAPLLTVIIGGVLAFGFHLLWLVPLSFVLYRGAIFLLKSILMGTLQILRTNHRLRHLMMATGIAFVIIGTGLQFFAST